MDPLVQRWLTFLPLLILLAWAAVVDARIRKIRNWLTVSLVICGFVQSFGALGAARTVSPGMSALGMLAGFSLPFLLFAIGALGGGDVKLMAGIGAWLGPWPVLLVFAAEAVIGMTIVLAQAAWSGKLRLLLRNTAVVTVNLLHVSDVGVDHVRQTGEGCRSIDRPLPFAVPTLFATLFVLYLGIS
jgi:prepilin peptidase CpaA